MRGKSGGSCMENHERLFLEILTRFDHAGILCDLILIGGWCPVLYREWFDHPPEIPQLRTADVDFLIPNPPTIRTDANVSVLLQQLGFELLTDYVSGQTRYSHPELDVEFLIPEMGKGRETPYPIPKLHVNAQGLRYLSMLQAPTMTIIYHGIAINVPEPATYVLHKIIVSQERTEAAKREKDLRIANGLGEFLIGLPDQRQKLECVFHGLPLKWRKTLVNILKRLGNATLLAVLAPDLTGLRDL